MRDFWGSHGREDRWILILLGLLLVLSVGFIWLQRKPLCIDSRLVDRVEFLHDEGVTTVYRCNLRKEPGAGYNLGTTVQKMNRALAVIDPISREFWSAEKRPVTLIIDGREDSPLDSQAISAADAAQPALLGKAIFSKMVANGGGEQNFWVQVSVDMMIEFAFGSWSNGPLARALRPNDIGWPIGGDVDSEARSVMVELVQDAGSPAKWREFLRLIEVLKLTTPPPQYQLWGARSVAHPEFQKDATRIAEFQTNIMRAHQFIVRSGDVELARSFEQVLAGLERHGLGLEREPMRFDQLFWTETEHLANSEGSPLAIVTGGGRALNWMGARVGRSLLPQVIAGESILVDCQWPTPAQIRRASVVANRILVISSCDKNLKWNSFLKDGVAGFARANPGVPFVQLTSSAVLKGHVLTANTFKGGSVHPDSEFPVKAPTELPGFRKMGLRGDYDAEADFYRVNAAEDSVLAYRIAPKASRSAE